MAKDPAFLFYPGDWLGGTMLLTRHQKGCYMDLLMAQFNSGPLSLDQIKLVLGQDQALWTVLQDKFKKDNSGRFFNQKLATEIEKRKSYVESRSTNKKGKTKSYDKSYENHMSGHMENENRNEYVNEIRKGVQGENKLESSSQQLEADFTDYELWTRSIIEHTDPLFEQMLMGENLKPNGSLEKLARDHLELLARYPAMRPQSQQLFRYSALKHLRENLEKLKTKNQQPHGKHATIVLNR